MLADFGRRGRFAFENRAEKESLDILGSVLRQVDDIRSGIGEDLRSACNQSLLIGTVDL